MEKEERRMGKEENKKGGRRKGVGLKIGNGSWHLSNPKSFSQILLINY